MKFKKTIIALILPLLITSCSNSFSSDSMHSTVKDFFKLKGIYLSISRVLDDNDCFAFFNQEYDPNHRNVTTVNAFNTFELVATLKYDGLFKLNTKYNGNCVNIEKSPKYDVTYVGQNEDQIIYKIKFNADFEEISIKASLESFEDYTKVLVDNESGLYSGSRTKLRNVWSSYNSLDINKLTEIKYSEYKISNQYDEKGTAKCKTDVLTTTSKSDFENIIKALETKVTYSSSAPVYMPKFGYPVKKLEFIENNRFYQLTLNDGLIFYHNHYYKSDLDVQIKNVATKYWTLKGTTNSLYPYVYETNKSLPVVFLKTDEIQFYDWPDEKETPDGDPIYYASAAGYKIYMYSSTEVKVDGKFYEILGEVDFSKVFSQH